MLRRLLPIWFMLFGLLALFAIGETLAVVAATLAASCKMTPQLTEGSGNPRPTKDNVASASTKAGSRSVACVARNPWPSRAPSRVTPRSGLSLAQAVCSQPR